MSTYKLNESDRKKCRSIPQIETAKLKLMTIEEIYYSHEILRCKHALHKKFAILKHKFTTLKT